MHGGIVVAPVPNGGRPDAFDDDEQCLASLLAKRVTEQPPQKTNVFS